MPVPVATAWGEAIRLHHRPKRGSVDGVKRRSKIHKADYCWLLEAPPVLESPAQIENLIHTSSAWAEATLAAARADVARCLETPQEQRDEDLGRNIDQAGALVIAALPSVTFLG